MEAVAHGERQAEHGPRPQQQRGERNVEQSRRHDDGHPGGAQRDERHQRCHIARALSLRRDLHGRQRHQREHGQQGHLGGQREATKESLDERGDGRDQRGGAEAGGEAEPLRELSRARRPIDIEVEGQLLEQAIVMGGDRRGLLRRQRVGAFVAERRQLLAKRADPIGPLLGGAAGIGHHHGGW